MSSPARILFAGALLATTPLPAAALVTFYVALEDLQVTLIDLAPSDGVTPDLFIDPLLPGRFSAAHVTPYSASDFGGIAPPNSLFQFQQLSPPFGPLEQRVTDANRDARVFITPGAGLLQGTTIGIEGSVTRALGPGRDASLRADILMNDIFSGLRVTPNTEALLDGRLVLRARTTIGLIEELNQGEGVNFKGGIDIGLSPTGFNWRYDFGPTGFTVFTTPTFPLDENGNPDLDNPVFGAASAEFEVPIENISLLRFDAQQPVFTINLQVEAASEIVNPVPLPLSGLLLGSALVPVLATRLARRAPCA